MMAFIEHQQQVFRLGQHGFALHRRHHQRMVRHHHFRLLNFSPGNEERTFAIVVAVAVEAAGFVGAQATPERIIDRFIGVIAQTVPAVAVEVGFQRRAQLLFSLIIRREIVIEKRQQILLRRLGAGQRRKVAWANVAPAAKRGGKTQIGNNFAQQRQILAVDLIL